MHEKRQRRGGCVSLIITAGVLLVPILYFLSSGPAYRLADAGYLHVNAYRAFYWPLLQLCELSPGFCNVWKAYLILCGA